MIIGIDIDNTITNSTAVFNKYFKKYYRENKLGKYPKEKGFKSDYFKEFLTDYSPIIYSKMRLKRNAKKVINKWKEKGYKIYFVTARHESNCPNVESLTKEFLNKKKIEYTDIFFVKDNKYETSKSAKLDLYIDDYEVELDKFRDKRIQLLKFSESKNSNSKYKVVKSWRMIDKIVKEIEDERKNY